MEKVKWSWRVKYLVLFLWIFLFSCKAHRADETSTTRVEQAVLTATSCLWASIQPGFDWSK